MALVSSKTYDQDKEERKKKRLGLNITLKVM